MLPLGEANFIFFRVYVADRPEEDAAPPQGHRPGPENFLIFFLSSRTNPVAEQ